MKASKLLNSKTLVKKLVSLIFCLSSFNSYSFAESEVISGNTEGAARVETDYQCRNDFLSNTRELSSSCARAGLPSDRESCMEKLEACNEFMTFDEEEQEEEKDSSEFRHCQALKGDHDRLEKKVERLEKARDRSQEGVEKADDRIEKFTADYHETTEEINTLADERIQAKEEFDNAIAETNEQKASSLRTTQEKIQELQFQIEQTQDGITEIYLKQRAMWTENKIACRTTANAAAQAVTQRAYAQKRSGQTYLSLNGMLAQQGRSARDEATIEHNRVMRNCTSIKNPENTKDTTNFGDMYLQQRAQDKETVRKLQREMRRLERRKAVAKKFYKDTLDSLAVRERNLIEAAIRKEQFLANKAMQLRQKLSNIQMNLRQETIKKFTKENELRVAEIKLQEAEAELAAARMNGSTDERSDAFADASGYAEEIKEQLVINADCINDERDAAEIAAQEEAIPDPLAVDIDMENDPNGPSPEAVDGDGDPNTTGTTTDPACVGNATPGVGRCGADD